MGPLEIFGLQLVLSLVTYALIAKWYVAPWLAKQPIQQALVPLIFPHALRHVGLMFLVPGVVAQPPPSFFAYAAAYGDLSSGLLALLALVALRRGTTTGRQTRRPDRVRHDRRSRPIETGPAFDPCGHH